VRDEGQEALQGQAQQAQARQGDQDLPQEAPLSPTSQAERLQSLLALTDDEILVVLGATPLDLISGQEDEREDLRVLMALLNDAEEQAGAATLRRWVRSGPITRRPIDLLARHDWAAFETALEDLLDRGFTLRVR
jgi:hypothetical protein